MRNIATTCALVLIVSACAFTANISDREYTVREVTYPGADIIRVAGLNNVGDVVGSIRIAGPGNVQRPFILRNGTFEFPEVPTPHFTQAQDINDLGDIVGTFLMEEDGVDVQKGFLYTRDHAFTPITFPGAALTIASVITNTGTIGGWFQGADGFVHGYLYQNGIYSQIDVPGAMNTQVFGMNSAGDLSGSFDTDNASIGHGFVLTRAGKLTVIDHPDARVASTSVLGINDRGDVAGIYTNADGSTVPFVRLANGAITDLVLPADVAQTTARQINNAGCIVGNWSISGSRGGYIAVPAGIGKTAGY